ncbi:MAG: MerR family transcriptional regulator [Christensenellales bacterium]
MAYTIKGLAGLAGLSTRTLRYYEQQGLLAPKRDSSNGYRLYGPYEVDRLQQILFLRELGLPLEDIRVSLEKGEEDRLAALQGHRAALLARREDLDRLITTLEKTIQAMEGEITLTDKEKFEGFKRKLVEDNEARYGAEIRREYGEETIDRANARLLAMDEKEHADIEKLTLALSGALKAAVASGDPAGELAREACRLHKAWLCHYWDSYTGEAHRGLTQMYVDDPRFTAYYEAIAPGCAAFLRDAVDRWLEA